MDPNILVDEEIEAGAEFVRRFNQFAPIKAAYWMKPEEDSSRWSLYIASDHIDSTNVRDCYGEVGRIAREMGNPYLPSTQVRLVYLPHDQKLVSAFLQEKQRYPNKRLTWWKGDSLGGRPVQGGAYFYPLPVAAAA